MRIVSRLTHRHRRWALPGLPLLHDWANPADADLDVFDSGVEEVDAYFRSRKWFNTTTGKSSPDTYQFRTDTGESIGYAAVAFKNCPDPLESSTTKARYLAIFAAGLHRRFQGVDDPNAHGQTYAVSAFHTLEAFALKKDNCVGLYLWVRMDNPRGIAFYTKFGFEADPGGSILHGAGAPHLPMRKRLR